MHKIAIGALVLVLCGGTMMPRAAKLNRYTQKRDFSRTPEPKPKRHARSKKESALIFVVQRHNASHLHYDLRLEINGVLASWAVPKGPPRITTIKRLAVQTEDHPMEYASFAGVIPEGYGAGTVSIWDKGTYCNLKGTGTDPISMEQALHNGRIEVYFHGNKLNGPYALVRTTYGDGTKKNWLLMKLKKKG